MEQIAEALKEYKGKRILLLTHHNADPDAVCSAFALSEALKQLGSNTTIGVVDSASKLSKKILGELGQDFIVNPKLDSDLIVLLDTSTPGQLSGFADTVINSEVRKIMLDHHATQGESLKVEMKFVDENARSTAEIVHELLKVLKVKVSREMALALILGMMTDTGHLRFASLNNFKIITELMETHDIEPSEVMSILTMRSDVSERIAILKAAKRLKF